MIDHFMNYEQLAALYLGYGTQTTIEDTRIERNLGKSGGLYAYDGARPAFRSVQRAPRYSRGRGPPQSRVPDRHFAGFPRVCAISIRTSGTCADG